MKYVKFGDSGLSVSSLCLGTWHLPVKSEGIYPYEVDSKLSSEIIKKAYDMGINFFDTANVYNGSIYSQNAGLSEKILGDSLIGYNRESFVVSTKLMGRMGNFENASGLSRKYVLWQIRESLKRLSMDYTDILHMHRPDPNTPIEETLSTFKIIQNNAESLYFGMSYFDPEDVETIMKISDNYDLSMLSLQDPYNLIEREVEKYDFALAKKYGLAIMAYIPIAQGILTDKYTNGVPELSRGSFVSELKKRYLQNGNINVMKALNEFAKTKDVKLSQLALAWILKKADMENITIIPILGATKLSHLEENVEALNINLSNNDMKDLENIAAEFQVNWDSGYKRIKKKKSSER